MKKKLKAVGGVQLPLEDLKTPLVVARPVQVAQRYQAAEGP